MLAPIFAFFAFFAQDAGGRAPPRMSGGSSMVDEILRALRAASREETAWGVRTGGGVGLWGFGRRFIGVGGFEQRRRLGNYRGVGFAIN
jgi:hypothetical protein